MTYTVIVSVGKTDRVFKDVHEFWIDPTMLVLDMGDHQITVQDYDGLIIKRDQGSNAADSGGGR